jgi:hypothetical protein
MSGVTLHSHRRLILKSHIPEITEFQSGGVRHELPSPAQTLGSWFRIPLKAWMSVCVYFVFVLSCV